MRINVVSESAFTVQGHGVHTAFTETLQALTTYTSHTVVSNGSGRFDLTHIHTVGPYSLMKLLFSSGATIVSAHVTPDSFVGSLVAARLWYGLARAYLRWFYNRADGVIAVSAEVEHELKAMGVTKPIYLVPNTIDIDVFKTTPKQHSQARRDLNLAEGDFVVVSSGQVQPRKRIDTFIAVAGARPDCTFIWVGGVTFKQLGAEAGAMDRLVRAAPANVIITGALDRSEVVKYYRAADLFFLPSAHETFGIVIVEAAAAGLPLLLRDLPQYQVTFADGYEQGSDDTFAHQIDRFKNDQQYYDRWRKASRIIAERYSSRRGAELLERVYAEIAKGRQN